MRCPFCGSVKIRKAGFGYGKNGKRLQRYECRKCRRFSVSPRKGGKKR